MSQHNNLRFQNLPSAKEAQALKELTLTGQSELKINRPNIPVSLLNNIAANAWSKEQFLDIDLPQTAKEDWITYLKRLELDHLVLTTEDLADKEELRRKCRAILDADNSPTDTRGSWRRFYKIIEQMSYGDFVLSQIAMGEKPLHAVMERYLSLKCKIDNSRLNDRVSRAEFDFDTKEYWHIRGRVRDATDRYQNTFDDLDHLDDLHPVFVEMYRPAEATQLLNDLMSTSLSAFKEIASELNVWMTEYRLAYLSELSEFGLLVRDHAFSISTEAEDLIRNRDTADRTNWSWLRSAGDRTNQLGEEQVLSAYSSLRQMISERDLDKIFELPQASDVSAISVVLADLLKNFHFARKKIKRFVDDHMVRVNGHNIVIPEYQRRYNRLQDKLDKLLKDINGKQIFRSYWEDNTLEIVSKKQWLETTCTKLKDTLDQANHLLSYLEWQQFLSLIEEKDKKIINALKFFPLDQWMERFDLWYYENFIEAQDLIPIDYNERLNDLTRFVSALFSSNWQNVIEKISLTAGDKMKAFLKSKRTFKDWLMKDGTPRMEDHDEMVRSLAWLFPINMTGSFPASDNDRCRITAAKEGMTVRGINIKSESEDPEASYYAPAIKPELIRSSHSERIHEIKKIARFFLSWRGPFEVWQNKRHVYFCFAEHGAQELIHNWIHEGLRRTVISKKGDLDLLVESMLNNQGRRFYSVFTQRSEWDKDNWSRQLEFLRFISFSRHAGFEPLFISWYGIFKNADFIAFLDRERSGKMADQGLTTSSGHRS